MMALAITRRRLIWGGVGLFLLVLLGVALRPKPLAADFQDVARSIGVVAATALSDEDLSEQKEIRRLTIEYLKGEIPMPVKIIQQPGPKP